jgi:tetratricopeptide (TPR) repeat protein
MGGARRLAGRGPLPLPHGYHERSAVAAFVPGPAARSIGPAEASRHCSFGVTADRRAVRTFAAAADAAPADRLTDLRIKQARALTASGDPTAGLEILRDLTATPGAQQARLAVACGIVAWYAGDLDEACRQAEQPASLIHEAESERGELADLQALIAHAAGAWEQHTEWQLAEVWHVPELAGRVFDVYTCVTEYVLHTGEPYPRLAEFARRLRQHAHTSGALRGEAFSTTLLGEIELLTGDLQAARTHLLEAATLSRNAGAIGGEALSRTRLGEALIHLGERTAAREQLDEALTLAHASALADHLLFIVHGPLLRSPEDPAETLALVDRAEALLDETPRCLFCSIDYYLAGATAPGVVELVGNEDLDLAGDGPAQPVNGVLHPVDVAHQGDPFPTAQVCEGELGVLPDGAGGVVGRRAAEHVQDPDLAILRGAPGSFDRWHEHTLERLST